MKGNLRNPKPISGLDASIRENKSLYFYMDVVNNRNLKAEEFFDYLTKKYNPNGDLFRKIDSLSGLLTPIRADKVNIVIQYKRAELRNKFELIKKLQNDFDKITDAQIDETIDVRKPNKTCMKTFLDIKKDNTDNIREELNTFLDDYLNNKKSFTEKEVYNYSQRLTKHISIIDYEKYVTFLIKKDNIKTIDINEVDQVIEVLRYFIKNLNENKNELKVLEYVIKIRLLQIEKYDEEIKTIESYLEKGTKGDIESLLNTIKRLKQDSYEILKLSMDKVDSIKIMGEENISSSITENKKKLLIWKMQKIDNYLNDYNRILNQLIKIKNILDKNDKDLLEKTKIYKSDVEESFINEILKSISETLNSYRRVCNLNTSDVKLEEMKDDYISKVYINKKGC